MREHDVLTAERVHRFQTDTGTVAILGPVPLADALCSEFPKDLTVAFEGLTLQLPPGRDRLHYVRCPVTVHELLDGHLAVSYQGRLLARFTRDGDLLGEARRSQRKVA